MEQDTSVIQVGIRGFLTAEGNDWGTLMAASSRRVASSRRKIIHLNRLSVFEVAVLRSAAGR